MFWNRKRPPEVSSPKTALATLSVSASGAFALFALSACGHRSMAMESGPTLNLSNFTETFSDTFSAMSIASTPGTGKRWFNHTPWFGDFGDARFGDPVPGGPFAINSQGLAITASKGADGKWISGLISSRDRDGPAGQGFAQKFGYFEMKAKLPGEPGVWPAFWLIGTDKTKTASEIDIIEAYGKFPGYFNSTAHIYKDGKDTLKSQFINAVEPGILTRQFNTFGVLIDEQRTTYLFNRKPIASIPTPQEFKQPFYILANLGLGGGWPDADLKSPQVMQIAYIKAFEPKASAPKPTP